MSVPFSSEEQLLKRSLFSSLFGVANRLRQANHPRTFDESQQPCSSSRISADHPADHPQLTTLVPVSQFHQQPLSPAPAYSPTTQLGHRFSDTLAFGEEPREQTPGPEGIVTKEQIYAEIVRECEQLERNPEEMGRREEEQGLERTTEMASCPAAAIVDESETNLSALLRKKLDDNTAQSHPHPHPPISQMVQSFGSGSGGLFTFDLEKVIKMVVSHVMREVKGEKGEEKVTKKGRMRKTEEEAEGEEREEEYGTGGEVSAEQILERKREQNNAAAARYRKRQKEQKYSLQRELTELEKRNGQLKAEMELVREELEQVKEELWRRWRR